MEIKQILLMITPSSPGRFNGIAKYAKEHGWHLTVADRLTHSFRGWTGDGALVTLRDDDTMVQYVRELRRQRIPVVDLSNSRPEIKLPRVCADNAEIGMVGAEHFKSRYFHHTVWFSTSWGPQHEERCKAFGGNDRWVWQLESGAGRTDDWKSLSRWLSKLIVLAPKPLGVFCYDDADASRVETAALTCGFDIPNDIAVLGIGDDEPLCEAQTVPISSVRHDLELNGYRGAELLDKLMSGKNTAANGVIRVPPKGVAERKSTDSLAASDPLVKKSIATFRSDLCNPPSMEYLAEQLGVSRATLDRAFASDIGQSPAKVLARLRLDEAKRLILAGELHLNEIAKQLGFCNPAYFTNSFHRRFGISPKELRKA